MPNMDNLYRLLGGGKKYVISAFPFAEKLPNFCLRLDNNLIFFRPSNIIQLLEHFSEKVFGRSTLSCLHLL